MYFQGQAARPQFLCMITTQAPANTWCNPCSANISTYHLKAPHNRPWQSGLSPAVILLIICLVKKRGVIHFSRKNQLNHTYEGLDLLHGVLQTCQMSRSSQRVNSHDWIRETNLKWGAPPVLKFYIKHAQMQLTALRDLLDVRSYALG